MPANVEVRKQEEALAPAEAPQYRTATPLCDVNEDANGYRVLAEVPGVKHESIDVRFDRTRLRIEGTRGGDGARARADGPPVSIRYTRTFDIPDTVDREQITANLTEGVLSVRLPKAPHAPVRQVSVSAG